MVEELVTDLSEWKVLLKKNSWRKWYQKSSSGSERVDVVDMFCASFSTVNHTLVGGDDRGLGSFNFMCGGNALSEELASLSLDHYDGWKLHRDWFKCMIAQLSIEAAKERDATLWGEGYFHLNKTMTTLGLLFDNLKWDLDSAIKPVESGVTKVQKVWYKYIDKKSGIDEERYYFIILEPTLPIPLHSVYVAKSGKKWAVVGVSEDGTIKLVHDVDEGEKMVNMVLSLTPKQIYGMTRVV